MKANSFSIDLLVCVCVGAVSMFLCDSDETCVYFILRLSKSSVIFHVPVLSSFSPFQQESVKPDDPLLLFSQRC